VINGTNRKKKTTTNGHTHSDDLEMSAVPKTANTLEKEGKRQFRMPVGLQARTVTG
jgi:hypothetical protein